MKKWWVLFFVLSFCHVHAENPSFPGSINPGFWGFMGSTLEKGLPSEESSPARRTDSLWLSVFWNNLNAIEDCNHFGVSSEWGRSFYRSAFLFSLLRLDSIYRAVTASGEFSFQKGRFNIGIGHLWRTEWLPSLDSWASHQTKLGVHYNLWGGFSLGGLYVISKGQNKWWGGLHWVSKSLTSFFLEIGQGTLNLGQSINFGSITFQSVFSYPGPHIAAGLIIPFRSFLYGVGGYRNSNAFSSYSFHVNWNASRL